MRSSFATHWNTELLDENYRKWQQDPASVDPAWASFFDGFELGFTEWQKQRNGAAEPSTVDRRPSTASDPADMEFQFKVEHLVREYRCLGHTLADLDPLQQHTPVQPLLELSALGFSESDLGRTVTSRSFGGGKSMTLGEMIDALKRIYCRQIGVEYMHISDPRQRAWLRERIEKNLSEPQPTAAEQKIVLQQLLEAELFERFLHTRYVGQKRFSLEGGESLMPMLEAVLAACPGAGIVEIVMGMAHRGRLNVLANFLKQVPQTIFTEFSENYVPDTQHGDGDVKYHLGYETTREIAGGNVGIRLAANPSHLEASTPWSGQGPRPPARAWRHRQAQEGPAAADPRRRRLHRPGRRGGDAQHVAAPRLRAPAARHIVVNNQIGFTTLPADGRSSRYCTDIAKMIEAPIFHVNGDDPEAVVAATQLALDFRQEFGRDVVIDLVCYRRHGHNEADEPAFTQPDMYAKINHRPSAGSSTRNGWSSQAA